MQQTQIAEEVTRIGRTVAATIAPMLEARLIGVYGQGWLMAVNDNRRRAKGVSERDGEGLFDHRFCLAVFGYDPATESWMPEDLRRMARQLVGLATKAAHDKPLTEDHLLQARRIGRLFQNGSGAPKSPAGQSLPPVSDPLRVEIGRDLYEDRTLSADEVRNGLDVRVGVLRVSAEGWVPKRVTVRIPPNLPDGQKVRVTGGGTAGPDGAPPGDLYITIRHAR